MVDFYLNGVWIKIQGMFVEEAMNEAEFGQSEVLSVELTLFVLSLP